MSCGHCILARLLDVAGRTEAGIDDGHQGIGRGTATSQHADDNENPAVDSLPEWEGSEATERLYNIQCSHQVHSYLPLHPVLPLLAGVHQSHVEKRGEDEGEKGHRGASDQVENCSKVWY